MSVHEDWSTKWGLGHFEVKGLFVAWAVGSGDVNVA